MASKEDVNRNEWRLWYDDLSSKIDDLTTKLSTSEIKSTEYTGPDDHSDKVWQDLRAAQDSSTRVSTDVDLLRKEMKELKDKNAMMYKALMTLQSDNAKLREDVKTMQYGAGKTEMSVSHDVSSQVMRKLDTKTTALETHISKLEQEIQSLRAENDTGGIKACKSQVDQLELDIQSLRAENDTGGTKALKSQVDQLEAQITQKKKEDQYHTGITCDGCLGKVNGIRYKCQVCLDYDLCENCQGKGTHNQHQMLTIKKPSIPDYWLREKLQQAVAFTADLKDNVTTSAGGKLICDRVLNNTGGCYSGETGVFTAPISGTYCFILTVSASCSKEDAVAKADVMWGDACKARAIAKGRNWSTGHAVIKVNANDKVWLKIYDDKTYYFESDWTTFTGMLIQPDV